MKKDFQTTRKERISYGAYFIGQNIFFILLMMFLNTFFLDIGISAAAVSVLVLVVKAWDAINDPIFGGIVDRTRFKKGKFLPWLRVSLFAIPLATILLFAIPNTLPIGVKIAWAAIAYILWDTSYTICDVPIFGIVTTMTDNQNERTSLMSIGRVSAMIAAIVVMSTVPMVRTTIGGWLPTVFLLSIAGVLFMLPICLNAKERIKPATAEKDVSFKAMFSFLIRNKYILIFYGALLLSQSTNIATTLNMIFARHIFGDESMSTFFSLVAITPTIFIGMFIPSLVRKIDKFYILFAASIASLLMGIIIFFVGYQSLPVYLILLGLKGIPSGVITMLMFMFTPDCAEYGTYKTGIPASGIAFSMQTFSVKLTAAIASSLSALALSFVGFISTEGAIQPEGFSDKLWILYNVIPMTGAAISLLILSRYKLRDKDVQIMAKANSGEISKEEANTLLKGRF